MPLVDLLGWHQGSFVVESGEPSSACWEEPRSSTPCASTPSSLPPSARDWPGVHSAAALADGEPLVGEWIDRSGYYRARQKDPDASIRDFTETYEVHLEPLPCWRHLDESEWRSRVAGIVDRIEQETLEMHHRKGTVPLGTRAVRKAHPHRRPNFETRSPRPMVHAFTKKVRQELIDAYREFEAAYRLASNRFRSGEWNVTFPPGCWKPVVPVPG